MLILLKMSKKIFFVWLVQKIFIFLVVPNNFPNKTVIHESEHIP